MFKFRSLFTSLALLALCGSSAWAQRRVTGVVTAEGSNQPLAAASLQVSGSSAGTYTGDDGRFAITVPDGAQTLRVRRIGYQQRQIPLAAGQTEVNVSLTRDVLQLEGVTVTGQATTIDRRAAATATDQVQAQELTRAPAVSLDGALQGKVTGATIRLNSGAPGGGGQIQIRGPTSILGSSEPLIVIDGVISSNAAISGATNAITLAAPGAVPSLNTTQDNPLNRLADINPNDIASIEVLKSAAASAIYGSKATNGVVVITTKRGAGGAPRFNLTQRVGAYSLLKDVGSRRFPSNPADLTESQLEALTTAYDSATVVAPLLAGGRLNTYDYQGDLFGERDLSYETVGSISGGIGTARYFVTGTNKSDAGIAKNTGAKRQTLRLNVDNTFGSRWTTSIGAGILRSQADRGVQGNDNSFISPGYVFGYGPAIIDLNQRDSLGNFVVNPLFGTPSGASNPFQTFEFLTNHEDVYRLTGNARADFTLLTSDRNTVRFTGVAGADRFDQANDIYSPSFLQYEPNDGLPGTAVRTNANNLQYNTGLTGIWTFSPSGNLFSATTSIGTQYEVSDQRVSRIRQRGLLPTIPLVGTGQQSDVGDTRLGNRTLAYNISEDLLAFDERLTLSGGVRIEKNSLNGDTDKYYYFPRGALAYRFVAPFTGVNDFKLRGSIGQTGNQTNYGNRDVSLGVLGNVGGGIAIGTPAAAAVATPVGNPNIRPERMTEIEGGFDATFLNNRVGAEFSYYNRTIRDLLLNFPLAPTSGFGTFVNNGGRLEIDGYEAALRIAPIQTTNFTWTSRTSYYAYKAVTADLPDDVPPFLVGSTGFGAAFGRNRQAEGTSTTSIWGNRPVDLKVRDPRDTTRFVALKNAAGNDSTVRATRDTVLGDARPRFQIGFTNDFTYKNFSVSTLLDWRYKGLISSLTQNVFDEGLNSRDFDEPSPCRGGNGGFDQVDNQCYRITDTSETALLGEYRYARWNGGQDARAYLLDGSFVKVREIALTYSLPQSVTTRFLGSATRDVRLNLAGRNLFMISNFWSYDPEVNNFGSQNTTQFVDLVPFPPSRSFFFSVDVGF